MFKGQYPTEDTAFTVSSDHSDGFTDTHAPQLMCASQVQQ